MVFYNILRVSSGANGKIVRQVDLGEAIFFGLYLGLLVRLSDYLLSLCLQKVKIASNLKNSYGCIVRVEEDWNLV